MMYPDRITGRVDKTEASSEAKIPKIATKQRFLHDEAKIPNRINL